MDFSAYSETMDVSLMHHGENQPHSYFIPFDADQNAAALRQSSKRFTLLNGAWDFAYYTSVNDLPADFDPFTEPLNAKMPVPGVWQMNGFDAMQYTNVRFPIPYDPPYVPADNPCGLYRHTFIYHKQENRRYTITFEGVDSCLFFYLNNTWVGCSQVTHAPAEYDITDTLRDGENTLCALVLKWSFGTYFEDQDKLRYSGIVRDVYILERDESHIIDFDIHTDFTDDFTSAAIRLKLQQNQPGSVRLTLLDPNGSEIGKAETNNGEASFTIEHPVLWSAESPSLYTLLFTCGNEKIARRIGLRKINIKNEIVLLNGKPIRFKGVNLHESRAETGACASREDLLQDLTLMKRHNINAVRTSHYPQSPLFYELCEELGVYVLDEADMECHGVVSLKGGYEQDDYNLIADDPAFGAAILDRVQRMVLRDRNFSCVLIYSMGNESGYGVNFAEALHWTKQFDPSRLTHYERASFPPAGQEINRTDLDLYSRMYPSIEEMRSYFVDNTIHKPYILCEFCHAMGNGPGDLEDYFQLFESEPRICGAFVWEWCDHAPYIGLNSEGKPMYRYGGDFGESLHDGNFCADGLVSSNRTPHTGLLEYRNVLRPMRILEADLARGKLIVKNQLDFITPDALVDAVFTLSKVGQTDVEWRPDDQQLHIAPHQTAELSIPVCDSCAVSYILKKTTVWAEKGTLLGYEQIGEAETRIKPAQRKIGSLTVREVNRRALEIQGENFCYRFDRLTGLFTQLTANGNAMLQKPMAINLFRAPTDNDRNIKELWNYLQYRYAVCRCLRCDITQSNNQITLCCETHVSAQSMEILANGIFTWTVSGDGRITCEADFQRAGNLPAFPRFGLRLLLPKAFDSLDAHGFGPYESYIDKHRASTLCDFSAKIDEQYSHPLRPQESGSHYGTTALRLHAADSGFSVFGKGFSFSAMPYLQEQLTDTPHDDELKTTDTCVLCLDFVHAGIGSNSCGPVLAKCYETPERIAGTLVIDPLG